MSKRTEGWGPEFDDPIELPGGGRLVTLQHAITWLAKEVPQSEHGMKEVQAAAHCVTEAAENNGPMMFARMGMMQAINRHKPVDIPKVWRSSTRSWSECGPAILTVPVVRPFPIAIGSRLEGLERE
jgi:hypothetical protein